MDDAQDRQGKWIRCTHSGFETRRWSVRPMKSKTDLDVPVAGLKYTEIVMFNRPRNRSGRTVVGLKRAGVVGNR